MINYIQVHCLASYYAFRNLIWGQFLLSLEEKRQIHLLAEA